MTIDFQAFLDSLPLMGIGMGSIFFVTGIIAVVIYLLNLSLRGRDEKENGAK